MKRAQVGIVPREDPQAEGFEVVILLEARINSNLLALLDNVAWAKRNCRHCDRPLWFVRVNGGHNVA